MDTISFGPAKSVPTITSVELTVVVSRFTDRDEMSLAPLSREPLLGMLQAIFIELSSGTANLLRKIARSSYTPYWTVGRSCREGSHGLFARH
jgi:hypothetical protein